MPRPFTARAAVFRFVFAFFFAVPYAHADSFTDGTIDFTVTAGSPAPTGSFVFDNTTNSTNSFWCSSYARNPVGSC